MDFLKSRGDFSLPDILSLEKVLEYGIKLNKGRVFADVWDLAHFSKCDKCIDQRINRLNAMNLSQEIISSIHCSCN